MGGDRRVDDADLELTDAESRPARRQLLVTSGVTVGVLALLGGLLLLVGRDDDNAQPPPSTTAPETTVVEPTPDALLEVMPAGPIDGKESWRLPVLVTPQVGVVDGQVITAVGRGFLPGERVGIVMCTSEAAVEGVAACELGTAESPYLRVTYANASADGSVVAPVVLRQTITTPFSGPVDCATEAERCIVAIGAVNDYDRSGGSFVGFAGAPPFPVPSLVVEPPAPYAAGQLVAVRASGLVPTRDLQVLQCRDAQCAVLAAGVVAPDGTFAADVAVQPVFLDHTGAEASCEDACVIAVGGVGLRESTAAPMPPPVVITFVAPDAPPVTVPPETAPPTTAPPETAPPTIAPLPPSEPQLTEPTVVDTTSATTASPTTG